MVSAHNKKLADRAGRALSRSYILTPMEKITSFKFSPDQVARLRQILGDLPISTSLKKPLSLKFVAMLVGQLVYSRELATDGELELLRITRLWNSIVEFDAAWNDTKSDAVVMNFLKSKNVLAAIAKNLKLKPERLARLSPALDRFFRSEGDDLQVLLADSVQVLRNSRRLSNYAEYKLVFELALIWMALKAEPSETRNLEASENPKKTQFQEFIECAVPKPAIGDEIIRGTLQYLRVWLRRHQKRRPKNPKQ